MKNEGHKCSVLVIDDDPVFRNLLQSILREKLQVFAVEKPSSAFKILKAEKIDIIICDFKLPEMNGLKVLDIVKEEYPGIEFIMISSAGDMDTVIESLRRGAADYFKKPFTAAEIWVAIERTRRISDLNSNLKLANTKNRHLSEEVRQQLASPILGVSPAIQYVKQQMEMVAVTPDTSVLVIGESGTGKELVARGIHQLSNRSEDMFGAVNMSALPEPLFESEFFGHKKGSFTGAIAEKAGWFESINRGTLFFDEVGEMSLSLQVKLLRVLETHRFVKIGTQKEQEFDIRIISATNKTVEELTSGKQFRLDLYHRLSTFIIELPPLRERKEDIPLLCDYYLKVLSQRMGKKIISIHPDVFHLLRNYSFPGNVRELRNLIERAIIMCQHQELLPVHFSMVNSVIHGAPEDYDLAKLERSTIIKVLEKVNFNKAEAARVLNIEWNALYRRIQKYKIHIPGDFD